MCDIFLGALELMKFFSLSLFLISVELEVKEREALLISVCLCAHSIIAALMSSLF
jgi:hypothetical protein